jgi:hypothetical protein
MAARRRAAGPRRGSHVKGVPIAGRGLVPRLCCVIIFISLIIIPYATGVWHAAGTCFDGQRR